MINIKLQGILAYITGEIEPVKHRMRAKQISRYRRKGSSKLHTNEKLLPLYTHTDEETIRIGLGGLKLCKDLFVHYDVQFSKDNNYNLPEINIHVPDGLTLRLYQSKCLEVMRYSRNGVIQLPTSAGKSEIFLTFANSQWISNGTTVLIIVASQQAEDEMIERGLKYNLPVTRFRKIKEGEEKANIIISTPQIIYGAMKDGRHIELLDSVATLILDESHHASCETWHNIITNLPNVSRGFGFSATPIDNPHNLFDDFDSAVIASIVGEIIFKRSARDPDVRPYLNTPIPITIDYAEKGEVPDTNDWHKIRPWLGSEDRSNFIANIAHKLDNLNLNSITFVSEKAHGEMLLSLYPNQSLCWFGAGKLIFHPNSNLEKPKKTDASMVIKEWINSNQLKHIIVSSHANESMNIHGLDAAILHEGKKSRITIQRIGRVLRKSDSKKSYIINIKDLSIGVLKAQSKSREWSMREEYGHQAVNVHIDFLDKYILEKV